MTTVGAYELNGILGFNLIQMQEDNLLQSILNLLNNRSHNILDLKLLAAASTINDNVHHSAQAMQTEDKNKSF